MELVEEPRYKDGDFLHSDWEDENITIIYRKRNGNNFYYHANKSNSIGLCFDKGSSWSDAVNFRLATESEKKELIDVLTGVGKRWNADKKCVEYIPKRKFKAGDKVKIKDGISSETQECVYPYFEGFLHQYIGKVMTVKKYITTDIGEYITTDEAKEGDHYFGFAEDWLELYVEKQQRKFKAGDKVKIKDGISSKTHKPIPPYFPNAMDEFIGKELIVKEYTSIGWIVFYEDDYGYQFDEDWLEPWSDEPKVGDMVIAWNNDMSHVVIGIKIDANPAQGCKHVLNNNNSYKHAVKFDCTKEHLEKIRKG